MSQPQTQTPPLKLRALPALLVLCLLASLGHALAQAEPAGTPGPSSATSVVTGPERAPLQQLAEVRGEGFTAAISNLNTGLASLRLTEERYTRNDAPLNLVTTDRESYLPLSFSLINANLGDNPLWEFENKGEGVLVATLETDELRIRRTFQAGEGPYQLWVTTSVQNLGSASRKLALETRTFNYVSRAEEDGGIAFLPGRSQWIGQGICMADGEIVREDRSALTDEAVEEPAAAFAGTENVYFMVAVASDGEPADRCLLQASERGRDAEGEPLGTLFESTLSQKSKELAKGATVEWKTLAYLGPKVPAALEAAGHGFEEAVDGGWFSALSKVLTLILRIIHDLIGNWGVAIVLLTFIVKALLYPLTAKQMKSMARMKELKPEMDRINELYAQDSAAKGAAMMELYKQKGVSPMSGCFPMLIQLPIWFSLYASLSSNVELYHAPFVAWLQDLSGPDPYFVLPLALGILMFLQQKMTPSSGMDPAQQKMMLYMMPTMMMAFMLFLPAGLGLYMLTNSALSIGQQRLIESQISSTSSSGSSSARPIDSTVEATEGERRPRANRPTKAERRSRRGK